MRWVRIRRRNRPIRTGTFTAWLLMLIALVVAGSVIGELVLLPNPNPSERNEGLILSARSDEVLQRACYDCHSHETVWPWYSYVPPVSFLIVWDVAGAREHLNFSKWPSLPERKRAKALQKALDELREKEMPLPRYLALHPGAAVSRSELSALTEDVALRYGTEATEKPEEGEEH